MLGIDNGRRDMLSGWKTRDFIMTRFHEMAALQDKQISYHRATQIKRHHFTFERYWTAVFLH